MSSAKSRVWSPQLAPRRHDLDSWRPLPHGVGQLGALAVIRTFLNFFLERDLAELGDR